MHEVDAKGGVGGMSESAIDGDKDREIIHIVSVAIRRESDGKLFSVPRPGRHCDVIKLMSEGEGFHWQDEQGFLLSDGRFARRIPALRIAQEAGQIISSNPRQQLYSEDLW